MSTRQSPGDSDKDNKFDDDNIVRGKKNVVIVGSYEDLEKAVKKKPIMRQTSLAEKVRKMVCGLASKRADCEKENIDSGNCKEEVKFEDLMRDSGSQEDCKRSNTSYTAIRMQSDFEADDSFGDLDCSLLEKEAIHACQVANIRWS